MRMADEPTRERFTLKRWSQRKHAAARESTPTASPPSGTTPAPATPATPAPAATASGEASAPAALPPVESLTFDADFTAFMRPGVDPSLKRAALKKLVSDPRFNVMDGLDVYIDDYSKFEPLDAETARSLVSARYIFDPPKTRVNEQGLVEDVPPDEEAAAKTSESKIGSESTFGGDEPSPDRPAGETQAKVDSDPIFPPAPAIESTPPPDPLPATPKDGATR
jgi:hypothetical protein